MARRLFEIKLDPTEVEALAERLGQADPVQLGRAIVETLNRVANETYDLSRKNITSGVNLEDSYVRRRMEVREASPQRPEASIIGLGQFETNISHYGAMTLDTDVNWSNDWILANKGKFSKWPGWTQRTGDRARGIEPDRKAYKVNAEVARGSRKSVGKKFTLPGRVDTDGNPLIFKREGDQVEGVLGPSVYQLFRVAADRLYDQIGDNLEQAIVETAEREFLKAIE